MRREYKERIICAKPDVLGLEPIRTGEISLEIRMTLDEYEAIRLIDLENLSQEECARHMNVARTTAQLIYGRARQKLARALVYGARIRIEGGNCVVCTGKNPCCGHCSR